MPAQAIDSNPPTGPGNIEIFPKRDMVAIEGYGEYAGKTAEIKVLREGTVIGSARGVVDGTGFLEVNHPGGVCWGAGTDLQVTPDIKGGDEIRVDFLGTATTAQPGNRWDGATTTDVEITDVVRESDTKLVFSGRYGAGVDMPGTDLVADPGKVGLEIVNPDMRGGTSAVGARAIGWPLEAGEPAPTGYAVTGGVTEWHRRAPVARSRSPGTFEQASDADLAEAGEAVALGWQAEAPVELGIEAFYGMTLYEFHEASGPGFGGCPAGPQELRPNAPTTYTAKGAGPASIAVTWGEGTNMPESPRINGYSVTAVRSVSDGVDAGGVVRTAADGRSADRRGPRPPARSTTSRSPPAASAGDSEPAVMRDQGRGPHRPDGEANTLRRAQRRRQVPAARGRAERRTSACSSTRSPACSTRRSTTRSTAPTPTLKSPTFVPGESAGLRHPSGHDRQVDRRRQRQHRRPARARSSSTSSRARTPHRRSQTVAAAPVSGAVDVTFPRLADPTVAAYRVQAYTDAGRTSRPRRSHAGADRAADHR